MSLLLGGATKIASGFNLVPGGGQTVPWGTGGTNTGINFGPGGISGCANIGGVQVCGEIPFGGGDSPPQDTPPAGSMPGTNLSPGAGSTCPDGYVEIGGQCFATSVGAYAPGGQPATVPSTNGAVPKVPSVQMVTPILPASMPKPPGYCLNKSGYYRRDPLDGGAIKYIPPKSVWRRYRRKNPMNAKALSRALKRVEGATKIKDTLKGLRLPDKKCGCK